MEDVFAVGKHQKLEMETDRKGPPKLSNSGDERAVSDVKLLNYRISGLFFCL